MRGLGVVKCVSKGWLGTMKCVETGIDADDKSRRSRLEVGYRTKKGGEMVDVLYLFRSRRSM